MFYWVGDKWELSCQKYWLTLGVGKETHSSSILCHSKRNGEDLGVIHGSSTSPRITPTSVRLEVQTHSNHKTKQADKRNHWLIEKEYRESSRLCSCQNDSGLLTLATGKTLWRNVITSWLLNTCWVMSSFINLEIGSFISKLCTM